MKAGRGSINTDLTASSKNFDTWVSGKMKLSNFFHGFSLVEQDQQILLIFEYLKQLEQAKQNQDEQENRKKIGYRQDG